MDALERWMIRIAVPLGLATALIAGIALPHSTPLPAVALGSRWILYSERSLALFYGFLLVLVPVVRSLRGVLPIELSLRGARYEEAGAATDVFEALDARVAASEDRAARLSDVVAEALAQLATGQSGISPAVQANVSQHPPPA